jgi:ADP-ribose pyrophosphatase YjhB (NUDIX family)
MPDRTGRQIAARDGEAIPDRANDQAWIVSWHPPPVPPDGTPHGSDGVCVTGDGEIVLISEGGEHWNLPGGRPEGDETWEETLRREMLEEACATVAGAKLLGFGRAICVDGRERGLVLVRSFWRAEVGLLPWEPRFEVLHRRVVLPAEVAQQITISEGLVRPVSRALQEAGLSTYDSSVQCLPWFGECHRA